MVSNQPPRTLDEQIVHLQKKGMHFSNIDSAKDYLQHISYFRFKYYWKDMLDANSVDELFHETADFDDVVKRYNFDRQLRIILFDAVEIIEVALRTKIITHLSLSAGSGLWYLDKNWFENDDYYEDFVLDLKYEFNRSTEPFAKDYIATHPDWDYKSLSGDSPDAWMIFEGATFGTLSKMYKNLKNQLPEASLIAKDFGLFSSGDFSSWLEAISVLRNIIAHHSRLWNRSLSKRIVDPKRLRDAWMSQPLTDWSKRMPFGVVSAMVYLCDAVCPENTIKAQIKQLIKANPDVPYQRMGFTTGWEKNPIWQ